MPLDTAYHRTVSARYRVTTATVRARTNTAGGSGGNRITYTDLYTGELVRIVPVPARLIETPTGGMETSISLFDVHLRPDLTISPSQVIRSDGIDYEVITDISPVTNRYATIARCRRLS